MTNLITWIIKKIIKINIPRCHPKTRGHKRQLKLWQTSKVMQLDKQFQAIPLFPDLKLFQHYSKLVE